MGEILVLIYKLFIIALTIVSYNYYKSATGFKKFAIGTLSLYVVIVLIELYASSYWYLRLMQVSMKRSEAEARLNEFITSQLEKGEDVTGATVLEFVEKELHMLPPSRYYSGTDVSLDMPMKTNTWERE